MGRKAKLKAINKEIASALTQYNIGVHEICYSKDGSYAVLCGIERSGTPRVCVIAPGGMEPEKMENISNIALRAFQEVIESRLAVNKFLNKSLQT